MRINLTSLIVGLLIGVALTLAIGVLAENGNSPSGRYQLEAVSTHNAIGWFVADTQTGDVYGYVNFGADLSLLQDVLLRPCGRIPGK